MDVCRAANILLVSCHSFQLKSEIVVQQLYVACRPMKATLCVCCLCTGSGRRAYSHEALKTGVAWPPDVDPQEREAWLGSAEFSELFKMTWQQYQALPKWKQQRLKGDLALF